MNKKTNRKCLALLLVAALVVTSFPSYVFGYANSEDAATPVVASKEAPVNAIEAESGIKYDPNYKGTMQIEDELLSKRGEFEKHFVQSDGSVLAVSYPQKVHYQVDGVWTDIDSRLELKDKEKGLYEPASSDFQVSLPGAATADILVPASGDSKSSIVKLSSSYLTKVTDGEYSISWNILGNSKDYTSDFLSKATTKTLEKTQIPTAALVETAQPDISKLSSNEQKTALPNLFSTATYKDVVKNVDVDVTVTPDKLKECLIIKSPKGFTSISYLINAGDLNGAIAEDNSVIFTNTKDEVIFTIPKPYMFDSKTFPDDSYDIKLSLSKTSGGYLLTMTPDTKWMNDPARVYPVTLDPTIITTQSSTNVKDTYVHSGDAAGNHYLSSYVKIGKTDGATCRGYINFANRPAINTNLNVITGGNLVGYLASGTSTYYPMTIYQPTSAWAASTISWANKPGNSAAIATVNGQTGGPYIKYTFPVDASVINWYTTGVNNGYMIKYNNEAINDYNWIYASDHPTLSTAYYPCLVISYVPDTTAPVLNSNPASSTTWNGSSVTLTLSATDAGVGVNPSSYWMAISKDGGAPTTVNTNTYTISNEGIYSVTASVSDLAGNVGTKNIAIYIDKTGPTATSVTMKDALGNAIISDSWTKETALTVSLNEIADAKSGITTNNNTAISYALRKTGETTALTYTNPAAITFNPTTSPYNGAFAINTAALVDGSYDLYVKVKDTVGNETIKTFIYKKDTIAPTGSFTNCLSGQTTDAPSLKGTVTTYPSIIDTGSGIVSGNLKLYRVTGTEPNTTITEVAVLNTNMTASPYSWDTTAFPYGNYIVELNLNDGAGHPIKLSKNVEIKNQMVAPLLTAPSVTSNNVVNISWIKTALKEINAIEFRVGETGSFTNLPASSLTEPKEVMATLPDSDGTYKVYARFVDIDGLIGYESYTTVIIDKTEPMIDTLAFNDGFLSGTIADAHLKDYSVSIKPKNAPDSEYEQKYSRTTAVASNPLCQMDITGPEFVVGEQYTIKVQATDDAGNQSSSTLDITKTADAVAPITLDPEIIISRPLGQSITNALLRFSKNATSMTLASANPAILPNPWTLFNEQGTVWFVDNTKVTTLENGVPVPVTGSTLPLKQSGSDIYNPNTSYGIEAVTYDAGGTPHYTATLTQNAAARTVVINSGDWDINSISRTILIPADTVSFRLQAPALTPTNQAITYQVGLPGKSFLTVTPGETVTINQLDSNLLRSTELKVQINVAGAAFDGIIGTVKVRTDGLGNEAFHISNVEAYRPTNLQVSDRINYKTYLRWELPAGADSSKLGTDQEHPISFNVYRGETADFVPGEANLLESGITNNYYSEINAFHGQTFYYKVAAVDCTTAYIGTTSAMSSFSSTQDSTAADAKEYIKRLGVRDHWEYAEIDTPVGDISIEKSRGNLVYEQTDATLPNEKLPVYLKRTYNSQSSVKSTMGYGWNNNFDMALLGIGGGTELSTIAFRDESGTIFLFNKVPGSETQYLSSLGQYLTLTKVEKDHALQISGVTTNIHTSFTMMTKDNTEYGFNSGGQLLYIGEPNGCFQVLEYNSSTGLLATVTTNKNLKMQFTYYAEPDGDPYLIHTVILPDSTKLEYNYDSGDKLTKVVKYPSNYNSLPPAERTTIEYDLRYNNGNCLNEIEDAQGNVYSFEYESGFVESDNLQMEQVCKATYPDDTYMTFDYSEGTAQAGSSTVTKKFVPGILLDEQVLSETDTFDYYKGHILKRIDPLGKETTYTYQGDFLLSTTAKDVEYQEIVGGVVTTKYQDKIQNTLYAPLTDNVTQEQNTDGSKTAYQYEATDPITDDFPKKVIEKDAQQNITSELEYTYDTAGNVTSVKDLTEGTLTTTTYDLNGEVTSQVESLLSQGVPITQNQSTTTYSYNATNGNKTETLTETSNGKTVVSVRVYDVMGREISTSITGYTGTVISAGNIAYTIGCTNTFDGYGRLIQSQKTEHKTGETDINTSELREYNQNGALTKETNYDGIVKEYVYDNMNQLVSVTVTKGTETKTTYTTSYYEDVDIQNGIAPLHVENAYVTEEKNGNGDLITKTYVNPIGQTIRKFKGGIYTDYSYSKAGDLLSIYVIGSNVGNVTGGRLTVFIYDEDGNNTGTLINPGVENAAYVVATDTIKTTSEYTAGKLTKTKDPLGRETAYSYDTLGRILSVSIPGTPNATTASYDVIFEANGGNTKDTLTNAKGNQRYAIIDELEQVIQITDDGTGADNDLTTSFEYDPKGNKTKEIYGEGNYKTFGYDSKDRLVEVGVYESDDTQTLKTNYTYDSSDNLKSMVDYTVDGATQIPYRYTYFEYDNLKRLIRFGEYTSSSPPVRSAEEETRYSYDIDDNLTQIQYPESVSKVDSLEFTYNTNKWLTTIRIKKDGDTTAQILREYTYDRFGSVATIKDYVDPQDDSAYTLKTFTYDTYGRPVKLEVKDSAHGSTVMESYQLEFDKASNITKETIQNDYHVDATKRGTEVRNFQYDDLDQLTGVTVTKGGQTTSSAAYTYDLVGNRLTETKDGEVTDYTYNSLSQLISSAKETVVPQGQTPQALASKAYTYDLNGAQALVTDSITGESEEYDFDAAGRLAAYVKTQNGITTLTQTNQYNGADQRIKKTETAGTNPVDVVNYFYQDGKVLYTTGSDANKAFNILGAGDNIIATEHQDTNGNASYSFYNKDLRGSTTNILGSDLASEVSYNYDWFGNTEISNPQGSDFYNQICYTGGIYDESTKQYYLNARYYDPEDGRFISQDTYRGNLRDANSWNLYAYCANNPVKYSDPSGHFIWFAIGAAIAIYDGVKAYQKAKKQGKSGIKAIAAVAGGIAVGAVFGKVTKALTATKTVAKVAQKVFKSKTVKKLETKIANKIYTGAPKKLTASLTKSLKKPPASGIKGGNKLAFKTGKAGEEYLAKLVGGESQVYFKTSQGGRYIDQLADGIAYESKVGYTSLTKFAKKQILKDAELIEQGVIKGANWNFFKSDVTGKVGASKPLLEFLEQHKIKYTVHQ